MKKILALLLAVVMVLGLAACAPASNDPANTNGSQGSNEVLKLTLTVWAPQEDQVEGKGWVNQMLDKFKAAHPEYDITFEMGVCSEGDAGGKVSNDPEAAADVYFFANDQIGQLTQAGALAQLGGSFKAQVEADNEANLVSSVTNADGKVYGFPVTKNCWFMYYNTDIFSAEDVKCLDTMLEKGKVSFPMSTAWYGGAIFLGNGGTMFGAEGKDASQGIQFGGENGYAAAKKMVEIANHPNFVDDASGAGMSGLKEGTIGAAFSGSWDKVGVESALGEKMGIAQPPVVKINGKDVQMRAFSGTKCVGVNPNCDNQKVAMEVAAFLASEEAQLARYELRGIIPAHKGLVTNDTIGKDLLTIVELNTYNNCSSPQPIITAMSVYWDAMGGFGGNVASKAVTLDNYMDMVDQLMDRLNNTGI